HRNRPLLKRAPSGAVSYTYDAIGNLASKTDAGGIVSYEYDEVNRLSKLFDHNALVKYELYDNNNRPVKVSYPHGMILNREWDGAGRVKRIQATAPTSESPAGTLVDLSFEYASRLVSQFTDTTAPSRFTITILSIN